MDRSYNFFGNIFRTILIFPYTENSNNEFPAYNFQTTYLPTKL